MEDPESSQPMQCLQQMKEEESKDENLTPHSLPIQSSGKTDDGFRVFTFKQKIRENSWFGKKCCKIFKIFTNTFGMTFLAEWGDRSQLATIVLAGINDVTGVCVGGVLGKVKSLSLFMPLNFKMFHSKLVDGLFGIEV